MRTEPVSGLRVVVCPTEVGPPVRVAIEPVAIGCVAIGCGAGEPERLLPALERDLAATMPLRRRLEFVRGRSLLRRLVAHQLGAEPVEVTLTVTPTGALSLGDRRFGVSLSHCAQWTVAAIYPGGDVGVDVQEPPTVLDDALVRRCLGGDAPVVLALPPRSRAIAFARVWAAQEACVKAVGLGLSAAPWRIRVPAGETSGRWRDVRWRSLRAVYPTALAVATRPVGSCPGYPGPTTMEEP